ncbi:MAG: PaaI family thioesterase [Methanophagales archaeon]|nr:hotdog fold thioesterase [Methanophagales archaeon]MCW3137638.1 PaaI family thioesterase [Methanophagales archaeon]MCW7072871.1 PaaI family thioesterase [Methanophagales archaeon]
MEAKNKIFDAIIKRVREEPYAKKLGMELIELDEGYSKVKMTFKEDMENIFGMVHGGAIFSLIDEAFETAANTHGTAAVALSMNITYIKPVSAGDVLYAEAKEMSLSGRIGTYVINVENERGDLIALCQALVYRKKHELPFL